MRRAAIAFVVAIAAACVSSAVPAGGPDRPSSATPSATPSAAPVTADPAAVLCPDRERQLPFPDDVDVRYAAWAGGADHGSWLQQVLNGYEDDTGTPVGVLTGDFYGSPVPTGLVDHLTAQPPADVLTGFVGGILTACAERGVLAPLDDLWAARGWDEALPPSVRQLSTVDGQRYWAPTTVQWNPFFYRADLFADLGVAPPDTFDELLTLCATIEDAGLVPITSSGAAWSPPAARYFTILNLRLNGAGFHRELLWGRHSWQDDRVAAVFDHWRRMIDGGCFAEDVAGNGFRDAADEIASGAATMWNIGEWIYEFVGPDAAADLDFFAFPTLDPDVPRAEIALVQGVALHADAGGDATALLEHLVSPAVLRGTHEALGRVVVDPRIDLPYDPVHARAHRFLQDAEEIVGLLEFSTAPVYAQAILQAFVAFQGDPTELDGLLDGLEETRLTVFG